MRIDPTIRYDDDYWSSDYSNVQYYCTDTGPITWSCSSGSEDNCKTIGSDYCCLYSKAKDPSGNEMEEWECGEIPTEAEMETAIAFAEAAGYEDVEYYCDQSIYTSVSLLMVGIITYLGF